MLTAKLIGIAALSLISAISVSFAKDLTKEATDAIKVIIKK